jgi:hypothetical protein
MLAWLSSPCPACAYIREYIREEVGSTAACNRCGHRFVLPPNDGRSLLALAWLSVCAVVSVWLYLVLGIDLMPGSSRHPPV